MTILVSLAAVILVVMAANYETELKITSGAGDYF